MSTNPRSQRAGARSLHPVGALAVALGVTLGTAFVATTASAQTQPAADGPQAKPMNERFYEFGPQAIGGDLQRPTLVINGGPRRPVFERLLHLKRSFVPELLASGTDPALR